MSVNAHPPVLCIAGPTASGKSAAAFAIAERWPSEIVSVDSAQVYRGLDIGTAKPDAQERAIVPHHLIDIIEPTESYSAGLFVDDARRLIGEIRSRGRVPLLVGGTMLYYKALWNGLDDIPTVEAAERARVRDDIDREALALGWPALHDQLRLVDPVTADRLPPTDAQRIQRALEVWRTLGRPLSSFHTRQDAAEPALPADMRLASMEPTDRNWLHRRIADRFDRMLALGLQDEVRRLRARPDLSPDSAAMRCVGYRQLNDAFEQHGDPLPPAALAQAAEAGKAATRQLAKRQLTWLRSTPQRHVVACDSATAIEGMVQWAATALAPA